jgi:hypothetical protein
VQGLVKNRRVEQEVVVGGAEWISRRRAEGVQR